MSLISSLETTNAESVMNSSRRTTEGKPASVASVRKSSHTSKIHRSASKTPYSISGDVQKLKSVYSTYQHHGQPLSKEAMFHAKQKYGISNTPANHKTLGLGDSGGESADLAARLANKKVIGSSDDSVESVIEQKAQDETSKIMFSKIPLTPPEEVPMVVNLGLKGKRDFLTRSAAQKALAFDFSTGNSTIGVSGRSKLIKNKSSGFAAAAVGNEFDVSIVNPQHPAGFKSLDLSKVLDGAERRAINRINGRMYPQKVNFQNGLQTNKETGVSKANKEVFKKGTLEKLERSAEQFLESQPGNERQRLNDRQYMYAKNAADAVRDLDPKALVDPDFAVKEHQKKMYLKQISSPMVLHEAQKLASKKLQDIDSRDTYMLLFGNEAYNKLAVKIALEHYSTQQVQNKKIYLGGGLWTTPEEVNTVARNLISPVVNEISERANMQRNVDKDIESRTRILSQEYENWNSMERTKEQNDKQILLVVGSKRQEEKVAKQVEKGQDYYLLVQSMDIKVSEKERELQNAKQIREQLRIELQEILSKNLSEQESDSRDWNESCQRDLNNTTVHVQAAKSHSNHLEASTQEYEQLLDERSIIQRDMERLNATIANHRIAINDFQGRIDARGDLAPKQEHKMSSRKHLLDTTANELVVMFAEKAKEEAEMASEEARLRQLEIDEMTNIRKTRLHEYETQFRKKKETSIGPRKDNGGKKGLTNEHNVSQDGTVHTTTTDENPARLGGSVSPKATVKSRFLSTYNSGKDVDSSASARSVTGVSGVLDENPEARSNNGIDLPENEARSDRGHQASAEVDTTFDVAKNDKSSRTAENSGGSITIEQFLFNRNAGKKGFSKPEPAIIKSESAVNPARLHKEDELIHRGDQDRRSFSGFSQGSVENDFSNEPTDDQYESDIKVRDSNDSNTSRKESFFKEII
ncbi:YKL050C [Saccharomyces arboricola H-6]|uniref:YKL050C n=1 Tax=Saccharomyces arboricola (strain H-6 / AS 2.3317 / CBS 10644) TaxID=1160507 RepID=J8PZT1_SACAR|nr:YKL050C [Saccharomyces arboricola H-6]